MAKRTQLDRAIEQTEAEIAVLQAAVTRMKAQREQMTVRRTPVAPLLPQDSVAEAE
jgi:hypothetical protein